jgi:hypothetical protein
MIYKILREFLKAALWRITPAFGTDRPSTKYDAQVGVQYPLFGMRTCCARSLVEGGMAGSVIGYNGGHWEIVGKYRRDNPHIIQGYEERGLNYVPRHEPNPN